MWLWLMSELFYVATHWVPGGEGHQINEFEFKERFRRDWRFCCDDKWWLCFSYAQRLSLSLVFWNFMRTRPILGSTSQIPFSNLVYNTSQHIMRNVYGIKKLLGVKLHIWGIFDTSQKCEPPHHSSSLKDKKVTFVCSWSVSTSVLPNVSAKAVYWWSRIDCSMAMKPASAVNAKPSRV